MNDLLLKELTALIELAKSTATSGALFLQQEIPDVISQLLYWKMTMSLIFLGLAISMSYVAIKGFKGGSREVERGCTEVAFWIYLGSVTLLVMGIFLAFCKGMVWLQILIAPKIYLIEYSMNLLGK